MRPPSTLPFRGPLGLLLLLALAAWGPAARADEVVEGTDFAYTVPTGYRTAPADALTALRSLATAFFQAAEPRSPIVPFGRGHAKGVGKQLDVVVIFGALPLVSWRNEHVVFDSLDPYVPAWLKDLQARLVHLVCTGTFAFLAYLMTTRAQRLAEYGDTTVHLQLSIAPIAWMMAGLLLVTALVHAIFVAYPPHVISHAIDRKGDPA